MFLIALRGRIEFEQAVPSNKQEEGMEGKSHQTNNLSFDKRSMPEFHLITR